MPPKKAKVAVAKKRPSRGGKKKVSKVNKSKVKATKRKTQMKKRRDKRTKRKKKERKKTDKAKKKAKKAMKKAKKKKSKATKKKPASKKPAKPKQKPPSDDESDGEGDENIEMKLVGMTVNQLQKIRRSVAELSKEDFLDQVKNHGLYLSEETEVEAANLTNAEYREKYFQYSERPTDPCAGPFQSNRFGAIFLLPGQ